MALVKCGIRGPDSDDDLTNCPVCKVCDKCRLFEEADLRALRKAAHQERIHWMAREQFKAFMILFFAYVFFEAIPPVGFILGIAGLWILIKSFLPTTSSF